MIRGTTPTLVFKLDTTIDLEGISVIWVTLKSATAERTYQKDRLAIDIENNTITLNLTQEDTLDFRGDVDCQIRILLVNNRAYASNIKKISLNNILKDGVIK